MILGWVGWLLAAAANGFVIFLFVAFGLAAAAGAPVKEFQWVTTIAVFAAYVASLHFMLRERIVVGILALGLWFPLVMAYGLLAGHFMKT